ncbi:MAG: PleD family two-component system response regulator [Alphaproteobacteria bacterium]|nr:PleD family two-component system response regulator [Alphaproteobacteria bacterium]MDX5370176.1 PleD family two-component system response regulator [Alphaproteobacteria bacterium]MDX5464738.1 PleD family two-component system response regulator [Alphaproteobacteria bacterium]
MTARVLVVDDIPANVKLLEAKLQAEYFDVLTASNGIEALEAAEREHPDIILLDVMMPGMDGFEVCTRLKANPELSHIPVVMVTALDQPSDRVRGLEAGADDFLTKPVEDVALFARVRSLVRLKVMTDELRMREATSEQMGVVAGTKLTDVDTESGRILIVEDRARSADRMVEALPETLECAIEADSQAALNRLKSEEFDIIVVSMSLEAYDGMRLCSHIRSQDQTRQTPILIIVEDGDTERLVRGLDIGVNDYLVRPIDPNELLARVRTQLRRRRYAERLRSNLKLSIEMAVTDALTGLYNRRYMTGHLSTLIQRAEGTGKPVSLLIMDIDHFKPINDTHGHQVGDVVLQEFARRISDNIRGVDMAARYGGEEFVVVMPDTEPAFASMVAERLRAEVAGHPFRLDTGPGSLTVTVSIGVAATCGKGDSADRLLKRADDALYHAKHTGRNRVVLNRRAAA